MSEFSESYHLEADDQHDGLQLLQRANLDGFVFPPQHGWMTIIPCSEFGASPQSLLEANEGCLLRYLLDQDAGWMFQVYTGPILACSYECRWLDWSAWQSRITVDASGVDVGLVWTLAQRHGHDSRLLELERILRPRIVRRSSQETGDHYDDFVDWPAGETLDNVAYAFARLLVVPPSLRASPNVVRKCGWSIRLSVPDQRICLAVASRAQSLSEESSCQLLW